MSIDNNKNGSGATLEDLLHIDDASSKTNGNKAPELESLLVPTKHTFVTSPWSRLAIIAVPFGVGFLAIFLMLNGIFNPAPAPKIAEKESETTTTTEQAQQTEESDGDARAKLALSEQANELGRVNDKNKQPVQVSKTEKVVPSTPPSPRPAPQPVQTSQPRLVPRTAPQPIRTYTPQTRTSFSPRPSISASARTVTPIDPIEQLNKLRTIGSYGKIAYGETSTNDHSSLDPAQNLPNQPDEPTDFNNVSNNPVLETTPSPSPDSIEKIRPRWQAQPQAKSDKYLDQESQIIQGKQTRYLTVGTFASGVLVTPLVQATVNSSVQQQTPTPDTRSVVRLTQDLRDNYGQVAIQTGTLLAVELVSVDGGSVAIAHVRAIIKDNTEYPISTGAISVTGEGGRPLIANKLQDRGGEIARNDLFGGAVSALGKVGEVINQPDNEEEIEDEFTGRIRRRSSGNRRNITGALLEGFFGQVSQNVSQRNQRATQEISSRPNAWFIPQGTKVSITVNRSLELP